MRTKKLFHSDLAFSLIEMMVALFIGTIAIFFTFSIFNNANRAAIHQDFLSDVQGNLRIATEIMGNEITTAGFGFRDAKDYALRSYNNAANVLPTLATYSPPTTTNANNRLAIASGAGFQVPALAGSDSLLTIRSDVGCESLILAPTAGTYSPTQAGNFNVYACLDLVDIPNLIAGQNTCQLSRTKVLPFTPPDLSSWVNRTLLIVDQDAASQQTRSVAMRITSAAVIGNPGVPCPTLLVMQIQGVGEGLQISSSYFGSAPAQPVARLINSAFFYVGQDRNLYNIPLTYMFPGSSQGDRIVAEGVDSMQLRYFMYPHWELGTSNARNGGLQGLGNPNGILDQTGGGNPNCQATDADFIPQMEDVRMVDLAVMVRSRNPDVEGYGTQGLREQIFDDPVGPPVGDAFRRRIIRKQILVRNLSYFQAECVAGY